MTTVLEAEGETIHPASEHLVSEPAHIASEAAGHDLHCFQALRRMDEIILANFMVIQEAVEEGLYDVVVGDESWDVDYYWHENPELKRGSHVWLTDFVGYVPMASGGDHEARLTADYDAEMIEHIARYPRMRDRAIFVGNPDDIIPETFGPGLPKIRDWTQAHFESAGSITGFTPPGPDEAAAWRDEFDHRPEEKICIVTVGGSGVGAGLLRRVIEAHPAAKEAVPELRMIAAAGPRIDSDSLPTHDGLEVRGYVDRLYRQLAVCDLGVVQAGLTTTMELTAAKRPFLYSPLSNHFEQSFHVRHRLDRHRAGAHMDFTDSDPIAEAIATHVGETVDYQDVETDGAAREAAFHLGGDEPPVLLGSNKGPNAVELLLQALGFCYAVGYGQRGGAGHRDHPHGLRAGGRFGRAALPGPRRPRPGFTEIQAKGTVSTPNATREQLVELCQYVQDTSPVRDCLANPVPVKTTLDIV